MAIIGKIRNNSILVVAVVAAVLIIFVLSDYLSNKGGGQNPQNIVAGEVFGEEIMYTDYEKQAQEQIEAAKQNPSFTEDQGDRIREEVWNQMINRKIFEKELTGFNFNISPAELNDLIFGDNIQDYVSQTPMFQNKFTGQFSVDSVKAWRQRVEGNAQGKTWWVNNIEVPVKDNRRITKYFNLISKGMYVTTAEANKDYQNNNRKYKIKFVTKQFTEIPDSTIKVTDEEIKAYYEKNKNRKKFEVQMAKRNFSWVEFLLTPTAADVEFAKKDAQRLYDQFKETKDDSSFVMTFAETKNYDNNFSQPGAYPAEVDSIIQKADSGSIVGPYLDGDFWKVVKIRGVKTEQEARCRHILIANEVRDDRGAVIKTRTPEEVEKRADSILNVIKKNKNFDEMVALTDDKGSVSTKGVYEWFPKGRMVTEFENACFNGKLNVLTKVKTQFGIHLVEPLGRRDAKRVKSAMVDVKIKAMSETDKAVRGKAIEFISKMKDPSKFQEVAQQMKLNVQQREISYNQKSVDGTAGGRYVASSVSRMKEGEVIDPILWGEKYAVIKLDKIQEKGVPDFDDVKEIMKIEVIRQKKAEMEAKKMKGAKSLEELANKLNLRVQEAEITFSTSVIPGTTGTENEVIGNIFSMKKAGDMSVPLKGKGGVYVVVLENIIEAAPATDMAKNKADLTSAIRSRAQNDAYSAIRALAKIEDKRMEF